MSKQKRLLIVDDDEQIRDLLTFDITQSGYLVECATDGEAGLKKALESDYDLILLDVMMPKMNGYDVCKNIRITKPDVPIIMLTAKGTIEDKTEGFDCGADDYLVKPFDIQEVLLHIRALLRRSANSVQNNKDVTSAGDLEILADSLEVKIKDKKVKLTPTEFELLYCLFQHINSPVSLSTLLYEVWGYGSDEDVRMVRVHIGSLRQKIETDTRKPKYLHTVTNIGYKLTSFNCSEE